jgi:hypothetical protein
MIEVEVLCKYLLSFYSELKHKHRPLLRFHQLNFNMSFVRGVFVIVTRSVPGVITMWA